MGHKHGHGKKGDCFFGIFDDPVMLFILLFLLAIALILIFI